MGHAFGHAADASHILTRLTDSSPFVTLSLAKQSLEIDHSDRDELILHHIAAACRYMDGPSGLIGKAITTQRYLFGISGYDEENRVFLPVVPVAALIEVAYYIDGVRTVATLSDYEIKANEDWGYVQPIEGVEWPNGLDDRIDAIEITFEAGFGDIDDVPDDLKAAALLLIGHFYDNREAASEMSITETPLGFRSLTDKYRAVWFK